MLGCQAPADGNILRKYGDIVLHLIPQVLSQSLHKAQNKIIFGALTIINYSSSSLQTKNQEPSVKRREVAGEEKW